MAAKPTSRTDDKGFARKLSFLFLATSADSAALPPAASLIQTRMNWRDAVWLAVKREATRTGGSVTRQGLLDHEIETIVEQTGSKGLTPEQTLSRVLQELRDSALLIFDGAGTYRISEVSMPGQTVEDAIVTEREALRLARVGQGQFRNGLMTRFQGRCPMTGIAEERVLVASHIVPWAQCRSAAERLDPDNGLLLSALWDAVFDRGIVSFDEAGNAFVASNADAALVAQLRSAPGHALPEAALTDSVRERLAYHRAGNSSTAFGPLFG